MKKLTVLVMILVSALLLPLPNPSAEASAVSSIIKKIVQKCKPCVRWAESAPFKKNLLKLKGLGIISRHGEEKVAGFLVAAGEDGTKLLTRYGDDALRIFKNHPKDGIRFLRKYGDDFIRAMKKYNPKAVKGILQGNSKGMQLIKEDARIIKYFNKYKNSALKCFAKNPSCIDTMELTELAPKTVMKLNQNTLTWLETKIPRLSEGMGKAFRDVLDKFGQPAADFIRKNWDLFKKAAIFGIFAANFDQVIAGGRDVFIEIIGKGADATKEIAKAGIHEGGNVVTETAKAGIHEVTNNMTPGLVILLLGFAGMILIYRYKSKGQGK